MRKHPSAHDLGSADVVLIGAGIMSATLASLIGRLQPDWDIVILERADAAATESSDPWNNAGTGHSGFCELNYMPDPSDGSKAETIAAQFVVTRQWWTHLAERGLITPDAFLRSVPHMTVVFGDDDRAYLRARHRTLSASPLFDGLEFSDSPDQIARWAPLVVDGREPDAVVAATRHTSGTDVDFGCLTRQLIDSSGARMLTGHTVTGIERDADGVVVRGACADGRFTIRGGHVFVGAGGQALRLLQRAKVDEVRGYGVLPVGAAFLRTARPDVVGAHEAKVYGQAPIGAPPMSVPHLDRRTVDGRDYLMFGPYATFSTKLLKNGRFTDFFATVRPSNLWTLVTAAASNLALVRFLLTELIASPAKRFAQLTRYLPTALPTDWETITAGQRAQLVTPGPREIGVLQQGTELVSSADHRISGLLGASPGASTAVPIMVELVQRCFATEWSGGWRDELTTAMPGLPASGWIA
ncbi:malate:quinone oxidoreductase [Gordonia sp. TBRC 11910]|uniref:Probable malate:quinone oxidoreductase n=1 Tax=Gordonia asplenii TaxID=2725283 RepID=A0A848KXE7_9ACTN|nr:malate:quinone oxidoreductase [Gordonia asplenii]NMO01525.1 malate:quinone oxidoreductase [Gordonia asplenii]